MTRPDEYARQAQDFAPAEPQRRPRAVWAVAFLVSLAIAAAVAERVMRWAI